MDSWSTWTGYMFNYFNALSCRYVLSHLDECSHGLQTPSEEIVLPARPKIKSQSQIFRYNRSIFCLPHRPKFSDIFDLCLHWVSVVRECSIWNPLTILLKVGWVKKKFSFSLPPSLPYHAKRERKFNLKG